jgi:hypothetical protein
MIAEVRAYQPACQTIQLTVNAANVVAQHRYVQAGFVATGEMLEGEPIYRLHLPSL